MGATNKNSPADGQGVTNDSTHLSHMTRLITFVGPVGLEPITYGLKEPLIPADNEPNPPL